MAESVGLCTLPFELVTKIARLCSFASHAALNRVCQHLQLILNQDLYERDIAAHTRYDFCVLWAAEHGQLDTLRTACRYGASINLRGGHGQVRDDDYDDESVMLLPSYASPLHLAIQGGHINIIDYLLQLGADVNASSLNFCTCSFGGYEYACPLHIAMEHCSKSIQVAQLLIEHGAYLLDPTTPVLHGVAMQPRLHHLLQPLLKWSELSGANLVRMTDDDGATALKHLCSTKNEPSPILVDALLDAGASVDAVSRGRTILHHAIAASNFNAAMLLLSRGADPLIPCKSGMSVLLICLNHSENFAAGRIMFHKLLAAGVDINASSSGAVPPYGPPIFFAACEFDNLKVTEVLLHAGARTKDVIVLDRYFDDEPAQPMTLLVAMLRRLWFDLDEWPNVNTPGPEADDIIHQFQVLLRHGASLEPLANEEPALKIASDRFPPVLLEGILQASTAENVTALHVKSVIEAIRREGMQPVSVWQGRVWAMGRREGDIGVKVSLLQGFIDDVLTDPGHQTPSVGQ